MGNQGGTLSLDTARESFHVLTVTEGQATVAGERWSVHLGPRETVLVPAAAGHYRVKAQEPFQALLAYVA